MSLLWSDLDGCTGAIHSFPDDREPPKAILRRKRKEGRQTEGVKEQAQGKCIKKPRSRWSEDFFVNF
ncbi:hypothetical protein B7992_09415 [Fibrobacter sp. UWH1]|nr:hypothetical protein B7992_09415 [Fibrobacter sp. UWH1]